MIGNVGIYRAVICGLWHMVIGQNYDLVDVAVMGGINGILHSRSRITTRSRINVVSHPRRGMTSFSSLAAISIASIPLCRPASSV